MREIKFRAWDDENKIMISNDDIMKGFLNVQNMLELPKQFIVESGLYLPFGLAEYEQFTGLHDKNGVEVYDGDLVIASWYDYKEPISDTCGEVMYNQNWCSFCIWDEENKTMSELNGQGAYAWEIEVIGNIHERSERL